MKIDEILKLVNAGYSKDEITALDTAEQKTEQKTEQKAEQKTEQKTEQKAEQKTEQKNEASFDYDKFAAAIVKAQQLANGKTNFGGSNSATDISKFF